MSCKYESERVDYAQFTQIIERSLDFGKVTYQRIETTANAAERLSKRGGATQQSATSSVVVINSDIANSRSSEICFVSEFTSSRRRVVASSPSHSRL